MKYKGDIPVEVYSRAESVYVSLQFSNYINRNVNNVYMQLNHNEDINIESFDGAPKNLKKLLSRKDVIFFFEDAVSDLYDIYQDFKVLVSNFVCISTLKTMFGENCDWKNYKELLKHNKLEKVSEDFNRIIYYKVEMKINHYDGRALMDFK